MFSLGDVWIGLALTAAGAAMCVAAVLLAWRSRRETPVRPQIDLELPAMPAPASGGDPPGPAWAGYAAGTAGLLLLLCAFLSASLFGGRVLSQADALLEFPPWDAAAPPDHRARNPLLLDQSLVCLP